MTSPTFAEPATRAGTPRASALVRALAAAAAGRGRLRRGGERGLLRDRLRLDRARLRVGDDRRRGARRCHAGAASTQPGRRPPERSAWSRSARRLWAGSAGTAVDQGERSVVYATAVAGALLVLRRRDLERWLSGLVLGAAADLLLLARDPPHRRAFRRVQRRRRLPPVRPDRLLERARDLRGHRCSARLRHRGRRTNHRAARARRRRARRAAADALLHLQPRVVGALLAGLVVASLYSPRRERLFAGLLRLRAVAGARGLARVTPAGAHRPVGVDHGGDARRPPARRRARRAWR